MSDSWIHLLALIATAIIAAICGYVAGHARAKLASQHQHEAQLSELKASHAQAHTEMVRQQERAEGLHRQVEHLQYELDQTRLAEQQRYERERAQEQRAREEQQAASDQLHQEESKILTALAPVKDQLLQLGKRVGQIESDRHQEMGELSRYLGILNEQQRRLGEQTTTLAQALSDNSLRGTWGELQLRNVVASAGLLEHVDFDVQVVQGASNELGVQDLSGQDRGVRPDMIVHLPGGKHIIVDAKVPYANYQRACEINGEDAQSQTTREQFLRDHAKALRDHVSKLSAKEYWLRFEHTPEFVAAFIPNETLLQVALRYDPTLLDYAFSHNVALTTPVTLWSMLKTVAFSWQQQTLTDDAKILFDLSRQLYGRFVTVGKHAVNLGEKIKATVTEYNKFANSLESRLLVTARKLKALDQQKTIASLEPLTTEQADVATLSAPELQEGEER